MKTWSCRIGEAESIADRIQGEDRAYGSDEWMRRAVALAYRDATGEEPAFIFSGWGAQVSESERAVIEEREPEYLKTRYLENRLHELRTLLRDSDPLPDFTPEQWVAAMMVKLGQAAHVLHGANTEGDRDDGVELLLALAAACLDAVESIEAIS